MHRTISGATLKKKIFSKKQIEEEFENIVSDFNKNINNCIYSTKEIIADKNVNFLNVYNENLLRNELKKIIVKSFNECEQIYPYLGSLFLNQYFRNEFKGDNKFFKFSKDNIEDFLSNIRYDSLRRFAKWFFSNCDLKRNINLVHYDGDDLTVEKVNNICFDVEFDCDFLGQKQSHTMKNYNFVLVEGFIETEGEIHHLMHKASITKEPYVVFCTGMSTSVKMLILENNKRNITEIFPVVFSINEDTINFLNDVAVLHNCEIISALKGQTISQSMRKKLDIGKKITFFRNRIVVEPVCTNDAIVTHRRFLSNKVKQNEGVTDINTDIIKKRIKCLTGKSLNLYVPNRMKNNKQYYRDLNYLISFFMNTSKIMTTVNYEEVKLFVPGVYFEVLQNKIKSLKHTISQLGCALILEK